MAAAAGAFVMWGLLPLYWKALRSVPSFELLCHRIVWSVAFLAAVTAFQGRWAGLRRAAAEPRVLGLSLLSACLIGVNWFVYIWAVNSGHILETSLGYYVNPLVNVLLGAAFFSERLRRGQLAAVLAAAVGVGNLALGYGRFPWIALVLACSFAAYGALRKVARVESVPGLFLETCALAVPALAYLVWVASRGEGAFGAAGPRVTALLVGSGAATSLPLVAFAFGVRRLRLVTVGVLQYIAPSIAFLLGVFLYREPFTPSHLVTFGCVWLAIALYTAEGFRVLRRGPRSAG